MAIAGDRSRKRNQYKVCEYRTKKTRWPCCNKKNQRWKLNYSAEEDIFGSIPNKSSCGDDLILINSPFDTKFLGFTSPPTFTFAWWSSVCPLAIVALLCSRANQSIVFGAAVNYLYSVFNHSFEKCTPHSKAIVWISSKDAASYDE